MVSGKSGLAYDMNLFDEAAAPPQQETSKIIARNVTAIVGLKNKKRVRFLAFRNITAALVCAVLATALIMSNAQITELVYDTKQAQAKVEDLKNEERRLSVEIEKKFDLRMVEQRARESYGMQKTSPEQVTYLNSGAESHATLRSAADTGLKDRVLNRITAAVTSIQEYFSR